jgi:hypothetical protein
MTAGPEIPEAANSKLEDTPMLFAPNTRRAAILNYLLFSLSLTAGLLCAAPNAAAQTSLTVNVPFAGRLLPNPAAVGVFLVDPQRQDGKHNCGDDSSGTGTPS